MPGFWKAWLFQLDPFTRLISGMVTTALHGVEVVCKQGELNAFSAPPNMTCGEYMEPFFERGGSGYLVSNSTQDCEYCAYKVGDEFYSTFGMSFDYRWRDLGIFLCFIGSNLIILMTAVSNSQPMEKDILLINTLDSIPQLQPPLKASNNVVKQTCSA